MKKAIALFLGLAIVLGMAGCEASWVKTDLEQSQDSTGALMGTTAATQPEATGETTAPTEPQETAETTAPTEPPALPDVPGIDFQYEIENFVPDYFNSRSLRVGEKDKAQGAIWLSSGSGSIYTSNENVVTVATNGAVTAVGEGTAYVLVVGIGGMREITQYVVMRSNTEQAQPSNPTEELDLPDVPGIDFQYEIDNFVPNFFNTRTLQVGQKDEAQGAIWLSSGSGSIYTSNENVVTVARNGAVTAVGEGTAYVLVVGIGGMREITQYVVTG